MGSQPSTPAGPQSSEICPRIPEYTVGFSNTPENSEKEPRVLETNPEFQKSVLQFRNISPKVQNTL